MASGLQPMRPAGGGTLLAAFPRKLGDIMID